MVIKKRFYNKEIPKVDPCLTVISMGSTLKKDENRISQLSNDDPFICKCF